MRLYQSFHTKEVNETLYQSCHTKEVYMILHQSCQSKKEYMMYLSTPLVCCDTLSDKDSLSCM